MKKQNGFTLIELIVVIVLMGIVAAIGSRIISTGFLGYYNNMQLTSAVGQVFTAMERMQRDIRAISSPSDIVTATSTSLAFNDTTGNRITYSLSGTTLMRQTNAATAQPLATGIQSLGFSYDDLNGNTTSTLANIRFISFAINIIQGGTNFTVESAVYPRNLP